MLEQGTDSLWERTCRIPIGRLYYPPHWF